MPHSYLDHPAKEDMEMSRRGISSAAMSLLLALGLQIWICPTIAVADSSVPSATVSSSAKEQDRLQSQRDYGEDLVPAIRRFLQYFLECERCIPDCSGWKRPPRVDCFKLEKLETDLREALQEGLETLGGGTTFVAYGGTIVLVEKHFESREELESWRKSIGIDIYRGVYQQIHAGMLAEEVIPHEDISQNDRLLSIGIPIFDQGGYIAAWYVLYPSFDDHPNEKPR